MPLAAYLMLFQLLVLRHPVEAAITSVWFGCGGYRPCSVYGRPEYELCHSEI